MLRLAQLAIEAGMPAGILNVVQGTVSMTGDALCRHLGIGKMSFTGSTRTGASIMSASAESGVKPVTLELGQESATGFADAAHLDRVARSIAQCILGNAGQVCVASSRLIVQRSVQAESLNRIGQLASAIRPGHTWAGETSYSPIISGGQISRIDHIVHNTLGQGGKAFVGGWRLDAGAEGAFHAPTILLGVTAEMEAAREEIFGPVLGQASDGEKGWRWRHISTTAWPPAYRPPT